MRRLLPAPVLALGLISSVALAAGASSGYGRGGIRGISTLPTIGTGGGQLVTNSALATQAALNLFVDAVNGSDANACTSSGTGACLTIQGAVNKVPKQIRHPVTISVAAGTYSAGAYIEGFVFQQGNGGTTSGAYLEIAGVDTLSTDSPNSGTTTSASALSGNSFPTLTPVSTGWSSNQLRSRILKINGGTGSGEKLSVYGNASGSNGVVTLGGSWPTTPNATSTWQVLDPCNSGTTINGGLTVPLQATAAGFAAGNNTPTSNYSAFIVTNNTPTAALPPMARASSTSAMGGSIFLSNLCITGFAGEALTVRNSPGAVLRWSKATALTPTSGCYVTTDSFNTVEAFNYMTGATLDYSMACLMTGAGAAGYILNGNVGDSMALVAGNSGAGGPFSDTGNVNVVTNANSVQNVHNEPAIILDQCNDCSFVADKIETTTGGAGPNGYCAVIGCSIDANALCRGSYSTGRIAGGFFNACATGGLLLAGGHWNLRTTALTGTSTTGPGVDIRRGAALDNNAALATITGASGDTTVDERNTFISWTNIATFGRVTNLLTGATIMNAAPGGTVGKVICPYTDTSGTPGSGTANTPCGKSAIASSASSATITNSGVTATSVVKCNLITTGASVGAVLCTPGSGSFTATSVNGTGVVTTTGSAASFTWNVMN